MLAVLVYHHAAIGGHSQGAAPGGFLGVEVFFVVSGYLITSLLLAERRRTGAISVRRFWFRRARRLLPALGVLLAIVVAYALLFLPDAIGTLKGDVLASLTYTSNWWQIVAHRSYFQDIGRPDLLKHLWSLAIEEQFYLFWPPLLAFGLSRLGRRRLMLVMLSVAAVSAIWMAVLARGSADRAYYGTDTRLSGLLLGSVMAFGFAPYRIRGSAGRGARAALDAVGVLGVLGLLFAFRHYALVPGAHEAAVFHGGFLFVDIATLFVIAAAVHPVSDLGALLGCKPMRWIGLRSYSLYLWHYPIFAITRPGGASAGGDFEHFFQLTGWPVFVLRLGLSFGAAECSYRYIESPIRRGELGRWVTQAREATKSRWRVVVRGAAVGVPVVLTASLLAAGLATAQPEPVSIPGLTAASSHHGAANQPDPSALAGLRATAGTVTETATTVLAPVAERKVARAVATTPPTTSKPVTRKPVRAPVRHPAPTVAPTTAPLRLPSPVLAIGDSVMLGARGALQRDIPGIQVDAAVSRQFWDAISVLQQYARYGALPQTVVIHMGTNGAFSDAQFDQMMGVLGRSRRVVFVTAREPRSWEGLVNARLVAGWKRWPNSTVIDWHGYAGPHADWFVGDGIHLTSLGQQAYADFVRDSIALR
ncbi:MAG: Acyltransferase family [Actinomycetia bacterium]|nr:Acyltransferase family [Actinomycetes bacterium]